MGWLVLIPCPQTAWSAAGRVASRTPLPLTDEGRVQAAGWAGELASLGIATLFSGDEQAPIETASILAAPCGARHRVRADLAEMDAGLWEGLTAVELKRRYPKVYKRWCDDPSTVCPPDGEDLGAADRRIRGALDLIVRKHGGKGAAAILGPVAFGLARCAVESIETARVRTMVQAQPLRYVLDNAVEGLAGALEPVEVGTGGRDRCVPPVETRR